MRRAGSIVLGVVVGCSGSTTNGPRDRICVPGEDEPMFRALTAQRWGACGSNIGLCLELAADGSYSMIRGFDDYAITDEGRWNFLARDEATGVACLDDGSVIDFALTPGGLQWGLVGTLPPREPLSVNGLRTELPELIPTEEFYALTANAWTKTNELDLFGYPTEMSLAHDGTFAASFRHGECDIAGTFSVVATKVGFELNANAPPNTCDTRDGGSPANVGASNEHLVISDRVLRLYGASYRDVSASRSVESLSFTSYGNDALRVDARWSAPLSASSRAWALTLHNGSTRVQTVTSIEMSVTPMVETQNGYSAAGDARVIVDRALHEVVGAGGDYARDEDVAIGETGLLMLTIVVSSYDEIQRYDNQRSFILSL